MRKKGRWIAYTVLGFLLILLGPGTNLLTDTDAEAAWQPKKPITFVIMAGKGGGADRIARLMQKIVQQHGWSPQPLIPVNKPGGAGAEALRFLRDRHGHQERDPPWMLADQSRVEQEEDHGRQIGADHVDQGDHNQAGDGD